MSVVGENCSILRLHCVVEGRLQESSRWRSRCSDLPGNLSCKGACRWWMLCLPGASLTLIWGAMCTMPQASQHWWELACSSVEDQSRSKSQLTVNLASLPCFSSPDPYDIIVRSLHGALEWFGLFGLCLPMLWVNSPLGDQAWHPSGSWDMREYFCKE